MLAFHDDNEAMVQVMNTGNNPTMRHIGRVHGVSIAFMHQEFMKAYTALGYIKTAKMAADIHTKAYSDKRASEWVNVRTNINVLSPPQFKEVIGRPGGGVP